MAPVEMATFLKQSHGPHSKTTARSFTGTELAEKKANEEEDTAKVGLNKATTAPTEEVLGKHVRAARRLVADPDMFPRVRARRSQNQPVQDDLIPSYDADPEQKQFFGLVST
jgi:hypothetical protein